MLQCLIEPLLWHMMIMLKKEHLHEKMDLEMVASALHYSKYHLHRIFTKTVGLTIHDYAKRRQLTEAAKLLMFSAKPIIEIALMSGYESQQAFTDIFKAMYKTSPAEFRETENFYPLQLEIYLKEELVKMDLTKDNIKFAIPEDADDWIGYWRDGIFARHRRLSGCLSAVSASWHYKAVP